MTDNIIKTIVTPWYKQFWPWFLISLPASVVIASIITIILAVSKPYAVVVDDYYKEGLAINRDLSRQQLAETLDIKAKLQFNDGQLRLQLKIPDSLTADTLLLRFTHPTLSNRDQQIMLTLMAPGVYQADIQPLSKGFWNVSLLSTTSNWEIRERISVNDDTVSYILRQ